MHLAGTQLKCIIDPMPKKHSPTHRTWPILLLIGVFALVPARSPLRADPPVGEEQAIPEQHTFPRHPIRLTAGDEGPFFSLKDLAAYIPPRSRPAPRWEIRPPVWKEYPAVLDTIPIVPREYSSETIEYLATHRIRSGDPEKRAMSLTFDCESGAQNTSRMLDTLREFQVPATFFVLGRYVYQYPELAQRMVADGHEIGNHSFFHPLFTAISPVTATLEITYTEAVVDWAVGRHVPMRYFRFPYAGRNDALLHHVAALGYQTASWDIDPRGWEPGKSGSDVIEHVRAKAHNGGILLMHCNAVADAEALPEVLQLVREMGIEWVPLHEVLGEESRTVPGTWP
jgi:peptidoglycan/xylan/chitin deacetylase (PgdA/CDA1 family)